MSKQNSHAFALERKRDRLLRTRQLWAAGLVIWAVVIGWVIWGFINALTDAADMRLVWLLGWLVPVLVLGAGLWVTHRRLRRCEVELRRTS